MNRVNLFRDLMNLFRETIEAYCKINLKMKAKYLSFRKEHLLFGIGPLRMIVAINKLKGALNLLL